MKLTVRLSKRLEGALRAHLARRRVALADFVRGAIAEKLGREPSMQVSAYDFGKRLFGKHGSGRNDLSANRKAILNEQLLGKHHR